MSARQLIVVDLETTGLNHTIHKILEVAAINTATDEVIAFVPYISPQDLGMADPYAMQINRYYERGAWRNALTVDASHDQYQRLAEMLRGNTLAGSNPRFDADFLNQQGRNFFDPQPWHHRLADLSAYAAGALGIAPHEAPGLADICERLGVDPGVAHSALDDAKATAECFARLTLIKGLK